MDSDLFYDVNFNDISLSDYFPAINDGGSTSPWGLGGAFHIEEPVREEQSPTIMAPPYPILRSSPVSLAQGVDAAINLERQDAATRQAKKRKAPTLRDKDWAPHKERIIELHITQNLPLRKVKEVMERDHDFFAT
jgi:hypothetical protein